MHSYYHKTIRRLASTGKTATFYKEMLIPQCIDKNGGLEHIQS